MSPMEKYLEKETQMQTLRIWTPILLSTITVLGGITSYFILDKLNSMNDKSDKLFSIVGEVRNNLTTYEDVSDQRFTKLETELSDAKNK